MVEYVTTFLGTPPVGWEFVPYIISAVMLVYLEVLILNTIIHILGGSR